MSDMHVDNLRAGACGYYKYTLTILIYEITLFMYEYINNIYV